MTGQADAVRSAGSVAITAHVHPDGDAAGSVVALRLGLEQIGVPAEAFLPGGLPKAYAFLDPRRLVQAGTLPAGFGFALLLDMPDAERCGDAAAARAYAAAGKLAAVDHHPAGNLRKLASSFLHDAAASSTCELAYALLLALDVRITPAIAQALLTGMHTDTGGFQYGNTSSRTLEIAAELMRRGADLRRIAAAMDRSRSLANLRLTGLALNRLRRVREGAFAASYVTHAEMREAGAADEDLSGIVTQLGALPGTRCTLFLAETEPGLLRGSLRVPPGSRFDARALAALLGGGGHPKASGFELPGRIVELLGGAWHIGTGDGTD